MTYNAAVTAKAMARCLVYGYGPDAINTAFADLRTILQT